jgi:hypothetical protein
VELFTGSFQIIAQFNSVILTHLGTFTTTHLGSKGVTPYDNLPHLSLSERLGNVLAINKYCAQILDDGCDGSNICFRVVEQLQGPSEIRK